MATFSAHQGDNCDLIQAVAELYFRPKMVILDVTYGRGAFWRKTDTSCFQFFPSDIVTRPDRRYDFRHLPYRDNIADVIIFDPPYRHDTGATYFANERYQNHQTTGKLNHAGIIALYADGMKESYRVLKTGGYLFVKCQDEIESGIQKWSHFEIFDAARVIGFCADDLFVLTQTRLPIIKDERQLHARKNHSYLWVFKTKK